MGLALKAETPIPFANSGVELTVAARCCLCPFFFEGECLYPNSSVLFSDRTPKLAAWAVSAGESLETATEAALSKLRAGIGNAISAYVTLIMLCHRQITISKINKALEKIQSSLTEKTGFCWSLELGENAASLALICAWTVD
ncbi:MAG: hypothetical protein QXO23_07260 [Candidatus Methanomethyliaceae archaeon]